MLAHARRKLVAFDREIDVLTAPIEHRLSPSPYARTGGFVNATGYSRSAPLASRAWDRRQAALRHHIDSRTVDARNKPLRGSSALQPQETMTRCLSGYEESFTRFFRRRPPCLGVSLNSAPCHGSPMKSGRTGNIGS